MTDERETDTYTNTSPTLGKALRAVSCCVRAVEEKCSCLPSIQRGFAGSVESGKSCLHHVAWACKESDGETGTVKFSTTKKRNPFIESARGKVHRKLIKLHRQKLIIDFVVAVAFDDATTGREGSLLVALGLERIRVGIVDWGGDIWRVRVGAGDLMVLAAVGLSAT